MNDILFGLLSTSHDFVFEHRLWTWNFIMRKLELRNDSNERVRLFCIGQNGINRWIDYKSVLKVI